MDEAGRSMHLETSDEKPRAQAPLAWLMDRDWVLALALAFAVGVVVWFGRSVQDFFGPSASDVMVPALVGQTTSDATAEVGRLKLSFVIAASQPSDRFPKDVVMGQAPAAGQISSHTHHTRRLEFRNGMVGP